MKMLKNISLQFGKGVNYWSKVLDCVFTLMFLLPLIVEKNFQDLSLPTRSDLVKISMTLVGTACQFWKANIIHLPLILWCTYLCVFYRTRYFHALSLDRYTCHMPHWTQGVKPVKLPISTHEKEELATVP